jgi:anaerobic C4-dicarboxylate transporter DcuA
MVGAFVSNFLGSELKDDPIYQDRLAKGLIKMQGAQKREILPTAKVSVYIFFAAIIAVVAYTTMISNAVGLIEDPAIGRNQAIMALMLTAATAIVMITKIDASKIANAATFKSGMSACVCVLGVAWLGDTFVSSHIDQIKDLSAHILEQYPWMLAITLFFASMLLYSQGATTTALMPAALAIGVAPLTAVASFAAVSALVCITHLPNASGGGRNGRYGFNSNRSVGV